MVCQVILGRCQPCRVRVPQLQDSHAELGLLTVVRYKENIVLSILQVEGSGGVLKILFHASNISSVILSNKLFLLRAISIFFLHAILIQCIYCLALSAFLMFYFTYCPLYLLYILLAKKVNICNKIFYNTSVMRLFNVQS